MVYDCILFNNELEVLDIRLHELDSVVDKFVIAEATVTHTNKKKPLYYIQNKHLFKQFKKKIIHILINDSPDVTLPWIIERFQFTALTRGLSICNPNDTILHGPVDEIPSAAKILEWKDRPGKLKTFLFKLYLFYLNFLETSKPDRPGTCMFKYKYLKDFQNIYFTRYLKPDVKIKNGGWHLTYMGGIKKIREKLNAFTHQELNNDKFNTPEKITQAIMDFKDPFEFGWKFKIADLNQLPLYVQNNAERFQNSLLIKNKQSKITRKLRKIYLQIMHSFRIKILRKIKNLH